MAELHDKILTVQFNSECIDWAVLNAVFEVEDKVFDLLYKTGDEWKEVARDLLYNK